MNKPIKIFRCGAVSAAIWSKQKTINGRNVTIHTIKLEKSYKSKNEWKYTTNFNSKDLASVAQVVNDSRQFLELRNVPG